MTYQSLSSKWPVAKARRASMFFGPSRTGISCERDATQAPGHFQLNARRLLKYWSAPRCCGFWRWPRRERSADIRSDLGQGSNAGERQNPRNRSGATQKGSWRRRVLVTARLTGCASLASCHLPFYLYARRTPVFQQSPKGRGSLGEFAEKNSLGQYRKGYRHFARFLKFAQAPRGDWQAIPVTQH